MTLERTRVIVCEPPWSGYIEVREEVGDVCKDAMAILEMTAMSENMNSSRRGDGLR